MPVPSPQFTAKTLARVRRDRWREEQFFDRIFNVVVGVLIVGAILGAWSFLDLSGMSTLGEDTMEAVSSQLGAIARTIAPSVAGYAAATLLLAALLGIWWWAERDVRY